MIDLYTAPTPNGWKASVTLGDLELPYEAKLVNLTKNAQKILQTYSGGWLLTRRRPLCNTAAC
jgi:glutathione S-transferase